jgi:hypothetical protein
MNFVRESGVKWRIVSGDSEVSKMFVLIWQIESLARSPEPASEAKESGIKSD